MDATILEELILLQFRNCLKHPQSFVSMFNTAKKLAALDYDLNSKKIIHISNSFTKILGLKKIPRLTDNLFYSKKVHPGDRGIYAELFRNESVKYINETDLPGNISICRCRVKHAKGYWKYLLIISFIYLNPDDNHFHKIAIIADKTVQQHYTTNRDLNLSFPESSVNELAFEFYTGNSARKDFREISVSRREMEVLNLLARGLIAKQIALKLCISTTTVISHKKNLISKFKVKNSVELVKYASQLMLV